ncbi:MAG TPA: DUF6541 family protein [Vicinamibacterales bacterium]|nr:DUF6541 family protein [Vicinamibacterales bacterium]
MSGVTFAAAILLWGLAPGLLLLWAAGAGWSRVERAAAAGGLSLALVACAAYAAEVIGLPVRPLPVAAVTLVFCGGVFMARRWRTSGPATEERAWPADLPRGFRWVAWLVWLAPLAVIAQLGTVTAEALLPPSLHDGLDHANWFRLIYELGSLDPHVVLAPPLTPAGEPTYYPWGMHAWTALLAQTTTVDPAVVLMRAMAAISAALPLSVYVFTAYFTGRGWVAMAAALLSLVFWWLPYQVWGWGGYPLLAGAIAALPAARLALSAVERRAPAAIAAAALCLAGLLVIHPSQLFAALLIAAVVSGTLAAGGVVPWRAAASFAALFMAAGAALMAGAAVWQPLADFLQKARDVSVVSAVDPRYRWPIATFFDTQFPLPPAARTWLAALAAAGAAVAVVNARIRPLLALHLVFGALVLLARHQTWATSLWYHLPERIWYAQAASLPALAAVGVGGGLQLLARAARRWIDLRRWALVVWPVALFAVFSPVHETFVPWAKWRLYQAVHRNPQLAITDRRVLPDFAWMRANIPGGEVIFNAPADWGVSLPFTGHRTVYWSGGFAIDPSTPWNELLALLRRGDPYTSHAGAELSARGIHYVYAARLSPALERRGRDPLEGDKLREAARLETLYESPTALILRIDDVRPALVGLQDSPRVRFEGFYGLEQQGKRRWRWTAGHGRVFLAVPAEGARECFVRVLGPAPGTFEVRQNGAPLELTGPGYAVHHGARTGETIEVEIVSTASSPRDPAVDDRVLGVSVTDIAFRCVP